MQVTVYLFSFVETPRKFIIAELSIRKLGSSSVLIIHSLLTSSNDFKSVDDFSKIFQRKSFQRFFSPLISCNDFFNKLQVVNRLVVS